MKIRVGFVSNSSSSSFCIVGLEIDQGRESDPLLEKICQVEGIDGDPECRYGVYEAKNIDIFGDYNYVFAIGIDAENLLQTMTIPEAKEHFVAHMKEHYNVEMSVNEVSFMFGESGPG